MEPTGFSEIAWLFVAQSNTIPSRTQLGSTCREWYWHVRRLEHGRFWQVLMEVFSTFSRSSRLSVFWTDDQRRHCQWIRPDVVTAREQHHPGVSWWLTRQQVKVAKPTICRRGCQACDACRRRQQISSERLDFLAILSSTSSDHAVWPRLPTMPSGHAFRPRLFFATPLHGSPPAVVPGKENWCCCSAAPREYEEVRGSRAERCHAVSHRAGVGCHRTERAESADPRILPYEFPR